MVASWDHIAMRCPCRSRRGAGGQAKRWGSILRHAGPLTPPGHAHARCATAPGQRRVAGRAECGCLTRRGHPARFDIDGLATTRLARLAGWPRPLPAWRLTIAPRAQMAGVSDPPYLARQVVAADRRVAAVPSGVLRPWPARRITTWPTTAPSTWVSPATARAPVGVVLSRGHDSDVPTGMDARFDPVKLVAIRGRERRHGRDHGVGPRRREPDSTGLQPTAQPMSNSPSRAPLRKAFHSAGV